MRSTLHKDLCTFVIIQGVPLANEPGTYLIILPLMRKFEEGYFGCVRNEEECVCSVCL
jgi:hypothetical protein